MTAVIKNELLAVWTYGRGELAQQRFRQKACLLALGAGLGLLALLTLPLFMWPGRLPMRLTAWGLLVTLLAMAGWAVRHRYRFLPPLLALYRRMVPPKREEAIITTVKVITERKTWLLRDGPRRLTAITLDTRHPQPCLIFTGLEKKPRGQIRPFELRLPVPPQQMASAFAIYHYFMRQLDGLHVPPLP